MRYAGVEENAVTLSPSVAPSGSPPVEMAARPQQILRVASNTGVSQLATSLLKYVQEGSDVTLSCIGVASIAQALKACARANGEAVTNGMCLSLVPTYALKKLVDGDGQETECTVLNLFVYAHRVRVLGRGHGGI